MRWLRSLALFLAFAVAVPAVAQPARVYAAASLTEAMNDLADAYARSTGRPRPVLVFAASSALARQVEAGAPAGVFVAADLEWTDHLAQRGRLEPRSRRLIARNRLVVVVPAGVPARTRIAPGFDLGALTGPSGRWTTGDPDAVPVGRYARAALQRLGGWERASARLVRAENVRAALAFVERGDVSAGIVYATDARASGKVAVAAVFPQATHPAIVYPAALTRGAGAEARAFHRYLGSRAARDILVRRGFLRP